MKFDYKGRGVIVVTLAVMLVGIGVVNYKLSEKSAIETGKELKAYEQAQISKNEDNEKNKKEDGIEVVDSKEENEKENKEMNKQISENGGVSEVVEKVNETSKEIKNQLTSEKNMKKSTYILDMKMTREKQRNELTQQLNEMINNPSTSEKAREESSNMKLKLVKDQETELKIENLLSTKGFENALVYISEDNVNVVINQDEELLKEDAAKVFDLVAEQANVKYENIKLMNNNN